MSLRENENQLKSACLKGVGRGPQITFASSPDAIVTPQREVDRELNLLEEQLITLEHLTMQLVTRVEPVTRRKVNELDAKGEAVQPANTLVGERIQQFKFRIQSLLQQVGLTLDNLEI